jgi:predicted ester cyclase
MNENSTSDQLDRNKAVALRFKKSQGTPEMPQVEREVLAPDYDRVRGGSFHLAANARDQAWPHPGMYLRTAFPDRVDQIERVVAERDRVGLLFRINATHSGNYFGIAPSGRKLDVYECAFLRLSRGQMVEGWFMMDELEKLTQLGAALPRRSDGASIAPAIPAGGEDPRTLMQRLLTHSTDSSETRNKISVTRYLEASFGGAGESGIEHTRTLLQHLQDYGSARGASDQTLRSALPDLRVRVEVLIAEGEQVWARCNFEGTHVRPLYGIAPTQRRIGVTAVVIAQFANGTMKEVWSFADELGLLLQLGMPDLLLGG